MSKQPVMIQSIETRPEHDPYTNISGICSRTTLKLDPRSRTVWVTQEYNDNATPSDEWNKLILTWGINTHPSEEVMRQWIEENMERLTAIADGFESGWNGNNIVGQYSDEALAIIEAVEIDLDQDNGPANYYEFWTVESWLNGQRSQVAADMTDEQLAALAEQWQETEGAVVDGSILEFITEIRDTLSYETEELEHE